ncbi:MAG: D-sedoheptulose 7-phosphate isomerase [Candidatus Gastranaerophilaceae bacterium]|jgi:D-sedoheptulose 7-phosphate isomerase
MKTNLEKTEFKQQIDLRINETIKTLENVKDCYDEIEKTANLIINAFKNGNKLIICGNGGSASDALHIAAEFVGKFYKIDRPGLPAIALSANTASITAIANDFGYDLTFKRGVEAFGQNGDILWGISTSGNSKNILEAIKLAKTKEMSIISLTGETGGEMAKISDITIKIKSQNTPIIQNAHITVSHIICELVESQF